jgi:hypothetical protein
LFSFLAVDPRAASVPVAIAGPANIAIARAPSNLLVLHHFSLIRRTPKAS